MKCVDRVSKNHAARAWYLCFDYVASHSQCLGAVAYQLVQLKNPNARMIRVFCTSKWRTALTKRIWGGGNRCTLSGNQGDSIFGSKPGWSSEIEGNKNSQVPWLQGHSCTRLVFRAKHQSHTASQPNVFSCWGTENSQMVQNQENIEGDQPVPCHKMAQSCTAATATSDLCAGALSWWNRTPFFNFSRSFWNISRTTFQSPELNMWIYLEGNNAVIIRKSWV